MQNYLFGLAELNQQYDQITFVRAFSTFVDFQLYYSSDIDKEIDKLNQSTEILRKTMTEIFGVEIVCIKSAFLGMPFSYVGAGLPLK